MVFSSIASVSKVADTDLRCGEDSPESVIFEGRSEDRNNIELFEDFQSWASNKPTIIVQGEEVQVVHSLGSIEGDQQDSTTYLRVAQMTVLLFKHFRHAYLL